MIWRDHEHSDLFARIDRWKQEVVKNTQQRGSTAQARSQVYEPHHMELRFRAARPALGEISGNPRARKRKAPAIMASADAPKTGKNAKMDERMQEVATRQGPENSKAEMNQIVKPPTPRKRGRPPKQPELTHAREFELEIRPGLAPSVWSASGSLSPRKASQSPSKKAKVTLDKLPSEAAIDMDYLSHCYPAVKLTTFHDLRIEAKDISTPVLELYKKLQEVLPGLIPSALKVSSSPAHRQPDLKLTDTTSAYI